MDSTTTTGMDVSEMREHRDAWIEHYIARMACGRTFPICEGFTDTADCCGMQAQDVYKVEEKIRDAVKS